MSFHCKTLLFRLSFSPSAPDRRERSALMSQGKVVLIAYGPTISQDTLGGRSSQPAEIDIAGTYPSALRGDRACISSLSRSLSYPTDEKYAARSKKRSSV